jgi:hypothetical protein
MSEQEEKPGRPGILVAILGVALLVMLLIGILVL